MHAEDGRRPRIYLELPEGYDTVVGEHGPRCPWPAPARGIASALMGNTRILIFDEATSALDYESERGSSRTCSASPGPYGDHHRPPPVGRARRQPHHCHGPRQIVEQGSHAERSARRPLLAPATDAAGRRGLRPPAHTRSHDWFFLLMFYALGLCHELVCCSGCATALLKGRSPGGRHDDRKTTRGATLLNVTGRLEPCLARRKGMDAAPSACARGAVFARRHGHAGPAVHPAPRLIQWCCDGLCRPGLLWPAWARSTWSPPPAARLCPAARAR